MDIHQQTRTSCNVALPQRQMRELALFAGAGGGILGGKLLGWKCVCAVEIDPYARRVLLARQADGCLEPFPIWDDVTTFDGHPWRGRVDVVSGGFPCQDISAGGKGVGIDGAKSGLWAEFARIIGEVQPSFAFVENSAMLSVRGLERVLGDLAALGFDARWGVYGAHTAGGTHLRDRMFIVAHPVRRFAWPLVGRAYWTGWWKREPLEALQEAREGRGEEAWLSIPESELGRVADGVADRVDRLTAIGNGQVPAVVRLAWETLMGSSMHNAQHDAGGRSGANDD